MNRVPTLAILLVFVTGSIAISTPTALADEAELFDVTGYVRDENGAPLSGVDVSGYSYSRDFRTESSDKARTGEDGSYTLRLPAGSANLNAWSSALNRGDSREIHVASDTTVDFVIKLPPPRDAVIVGQVVGSDGHPIEGATVSMGPSYSYPCCWTTDAQPTEAPKPTPTETPPTPSQEPTSDGGGTTGSAGTSSSPPSDDYSEPDARIMPIWCCEDHDYRETRTDAQGRYEFATYAGMRQITATAKGHAQSSLTIEAVAGQTTEAPDLTIEKVPDATAVVTGRIIDARTGLPIAGAHVSLSNQEWGRWNSTTTGADGTYRFLTIPGWVQLSASGGWDYPVAMLDGDLRAEGRPAQIQQNYQTYTKSFAVTSGDNRRDVDLVPKTLPTIALVGYIVDPDTKKAVPNAWLNIWNQDTGEWGSAQTDKDGSYRILVRPGYHQVTAWAEGHLSGADMVNVAENAGSVRFDLFMPKGTTKYAYCDECYTHGYDDMPATRMNTAGAPAMDASSGSKEIGTAQGESLVGDGRAATYFGSAGGLGPYDPDAATAAGDATPRAPVPAPGLVALAALAGIVAVALRRRA